MLLRNGSQIYKTGLLVKVVIFIFYKINTWQTSWFFLFYCLNKFIIRIRTLPCTSHFTQPIRLFWKWILLKIQYNSYHITVKAGELLATVMKVGYRNYRDNLLKNCGAEQGFLFYNLTDSNLCFLRHTFNY